MTKKDKKLLKKSINQLVFMSILAIIVTAIFQLGWYMFPIGTPVTYHYYLYILVPIIGTWLLTNGLYFSIKQFTNDEA